MNLFFGRDDTRFWVIQEGKEQPEYVTESEWFALLEMARVEPPKPRDEPVKLKLTLQATVDKYAGEYVPGAVPVETVTGGVDVAEIRFGS